MYQIIEVIVLAAIAFLIISNFISSVGTVDDDDPALKQGQMRNSGSIKDVTNTILNGAQEGPSNDRKFNYEEVKKYFSDSLTKEEVLNINSTLGSIDVNMSPEKFLKCADSAFKMIINEIRNAKINLDSNNETLSNLIDKRYINQFINLIDSKNYKKFDLQNTKCLISDSYSFSRSIFINVSFSCSDGLLLEEWTFQKTPHSLSNIWVLSNINVLS